jgi:hypothetical protein
LVRHPVVVFLSQFKTFGHPVKGFYLSGNKKDEVFEDPRYPKHKNFINSLADLLHKEFAVYCMNNFHIYNHEINSENYFTIFYEDLLLDPVNTLKLIINNWSLNVNPIENIIHDQQAKFDETSKQYLNKKQQVSKWKNYLSDTDKKKFQNILDYFEIKIYNMSEIMPINL